MPLHENGFEGTLEPYMVISENFILVPVWDERTPPNKNNNNNNNIYIYCIHQLRSVLRSVILSSIHIYIYMVNWLFTRCLHFLSCEITVSNNTLKTCSIVSVVL